VEISQDMYNATSDVLDLPCFKFSGFMTDGNGKIISATELKKMYRAFSTAPANAISTIALALKTDKKVRPEIREKRGILVIPETIFNFAAEPQAFTIVEGPGTIQVNVGIFISLLAMTYTIAWFQNILHRSSHISIDEIENLVIPREILIEMHDVMKIWNSVDNTGSSGLDDIWDHMDRKNLEVARIPLQKMLVFVTFHEFFHWYKTVCLSDAWEEIRGRVKNELTSWLSEDPTVSKAIRQNISLLFKSDPKAFEYWTEEIQADLMASEYCRDYFPGGFSDLYATQAWLYSMLLMMQEVFYKFIAKKAMSMRTHPPANIRQSIICYINARHLKISQVEFLTKQWGTGVIISALMSRIFTLYFSMLSNN